MRTGRGTDCTPGASLAEPPSASCTEPGVQAVFYARLQRRPSLRYTEPGEHPAWLREGRERGEAAQAGRPGGRARGAGSAAGGRTAGPSSPVPPCPLLTLPSSHSHLPCGHHVPRLGGRLLSRVLPASSPCILRAWNAAPPPALSTDWLANKARDQDFGPWTQVLKWRVKGSAVTSFILIREQWPGDIWPQEVKLGTCL